MSPDRGKPPKKKREKLTASSPELASSEDDYVVFSFRHLQKGFATDDLSVEQRSKLALRLETLSQMTWNEVYRSQRHGLGTEKIPSAQIKSSIPERFNDRGVFIVFRFAGLLPMVGIRARNVFYAIWLEPSFGDLYDHE